jgi:hypothetical protein
LNPVESGGAARPRHVASLGVRVPSASASARRCSCPRCTAPLSKRTGRCQSLIGRDRKVEILHQATHGVVVQRASHNVEQPQQDGAARRTEEPLSVRLPIWQAARRPGAVQPFDCRGRRAPFGMAPAALLDTLRPGRGCKVSHHVGAPAARRSGRPGSIPGRGARRASCDMAPRP